MKDRIKAYNNYLRCLRYFLMGQLHPKYKEGREVVLGTREALGISTEIGSTSPQLLYRQLRELPLSYWGEDTILVSSVKDLKTKGILLIASMRRREFYHDPNPNSLLPGKRFLKGFGENEPIKNNGRALYRPISKKWLRSNHEVIEKQKFIIVKG